MVRTQRKRLLARIMLTVVLNTDPEAGPPEVKPRPMKTISSASIKKKTAQMERHEVFYLNLDSCSKKNFGIAKARTVCWCW